MTRPRHFLGFHAFLYDASAALVRDGEVIASVAQERLDRQKHSDAFPEDAIRACLEEAGIGVDELDGVAFTYRPWRHMTRRALAIAQGMPESLAFWRSHGGIWGQMVRARPTFRDRIGGRQVPFHYQLHHRCHAAAAFYLSPFPRAAVLTLDGSGEAEATTMSLADERGLHLLESIWFPHSLGYLYAAVTRYLGFQPACDEGKVMGLASYGDASRFPELIHLVRPTRAGYQLDLRWFAFHRNGAHPGNDRPYFSPLFESTFGPPRRKGEPLDDRHAHIAAGVQAVLDRTVLYLADVLLRRTGERRLCLAGGVALNSVTNGRLLDERPGVELFLAPPCGDDGAPIGAALLAHHDRPGRPRVGLRTPFLGPAPQAHDIELAAKESTIPFTRLSDPAAEAARRLARGEVVGWYQGRSEVGPRALGHRSILADPRDPEMKDRVNRRVKHREPFRPFAPVIPRERYHEYFEGIDDRPYMLTVAKVREEKKDVVPAITHVDGTARVQTITAESDPTLHRLVEAFDALTGVPVVLNTSFNVMGEPLVQSPREAISCFQNTDIDALIVGDLLFSRETSG